MQIMTALFIVLWGEISLGKLIFGYINNVESIMTLAQNVGRNMSPSGHINLQPEN
jgi:hypothetical protein